MAVQPHSAPSRLPQEYPEDEIDRPSEGGARKALVICIVLVLAGLIMYGLTVGRPNFGPNSTVNIHGQNAPEHVPFKKNFGASGNVF